MVEGATASQIDGGLVMPERPGSWRRGWNDRYHVNATRGSPYEAHEALVSLSG
jgi:hypothetical protein